MDAAASTGRRRTPARHEFGETHGGGGDPADRMTMLAELWSPGYLPSVESREKVR